MIRVEVEQGTDAWRMARLGIVTASELDRLVTAKTLKPSTQAGGYLKRLVAEALLGRPVDDEGSSAWMERGTEMELDAVAYYEFDRDVETEKVGFIMRDDRRVGCSPDRLVGEDGGLELKVPSAHVHVGYMMDPDSLVADYRGQVQGCLLVTGRAWWDVLSYNPVLPSVLVRVAPDLAYQAAIEPALARFLADLDAAKSKCSALISAHAEAVESNPFL